MIRVEDAINRTTTLLALNDVDVSDILADLIHYVKANEPVTGMTLQDHLAIAMQYVTEDEGFDKALNDYLDH